MPDSEPEYELDLAGHSQPHKRPRLPNQNTNRHKTLANSTKPTPDPVTLAPPHRPSQPEPSSDQSLLVEQHPSIALRPVQIVSQPQVQLPKSVSPLQAPRAGSADLLPSHIENLPPLPHPHPTTTTTDPLDAFPAPNFSQSQTIPVKNQPDQGVDDPHGSEMFVRGFADEVDDDARSVASLPAAQVDLSSSQLGSGGEDEVMLAVEEDGIVDGAESEEVDLVGAEDEPFLAGEGSSPWAPSQPPIWLSDVTPALALPSTGLAQPASPTLDAPVAFNPPVEDVSQAVAAEEEEDELAVPPSSEGMDYGDDIWADMDTMDWTGTQQGKDAEVTAEDDEGDDVPFPDPTPAPAFVDPGEKAMPAFVSGKGKAINFSKAALDKAAALLDAVEDDDAAAAAAGLPSSKDDQATPVPSRIGIAPGLVRMINAAGEEAVPETVAFSTGRGVAFTLSAQAIAASKKLLEQQSPEKDRNATARPDPDRTPAPLRFGSGLASDGGASGRAGAHLGSPAPRSWDGLGELLTSNGGPVAGPSVAGLAQARRMTADTSSSSPPQELTVLAPSDQGLSVESVPMLGFTSGSGASVAGPSQETRDRVDKLLSEGEPDVFGSETPSRPTRAQRAKSVEFGTNVSPLPLLVRPGTTTPAPKAAVAAAAPPPAPQSGTLSSPTVPKLADFTPVVQPTPLPKPNFNSPALSRVNSTGTPARYPTFRPPLGLRAQGSISRPESAVGGAMSTPKASPAARRLNTDMNKRTRPNTLQKFSTPFKNGVRPEGLTLVGTPQSARKAAGAARVAEKPAKSVKVEQMFEPVFDLTRKLLVDEGTGW